MGLLGVRLSLLYMPLKVNIEKEEFLKMLAKRRNGESSAEEEAFLDAYYNLFDLRENALEQLAAAQKESIKNAIRDGIKLEPSKTEEQVAHLKYYIWRYITAAACVLLIAFSFLMNSPGPNSKIKTSAQTYKIQPGSTKAILRLANGSEVLLNEGHDEGEIYDLIGKDISSPTAFNMVTTPRGGQYQLDLPDGSKVWLNSASSIKFPSEFNGDTRKVEMTGEVYFEIAKKHQPFIVTAKGQEVEVLGTHFNINAYPDEAHTQTTLLEGSVKVRGADHSVHYLKPGQQSLISSEGDFQSITAADTEMAVAWKNGYFKFDRQNLQAIMRQVSRWYDVEVEYTGDIPADEFVGKIKRSGDVYGVLKVLRLSKVNFTVKGRKIIVNN